MSLEKNSTFVLIVQITLPILAVAIAAWAFISPTAYSDDPGDKVGYLFSKTSDEILKFTYFDASTEQFKQKLSYRIETCQKLNPENCRPLVPGHEVVSAIQVKKLTSGADMREYVCGGASSLLYAGLWLKNKLEWVPEKSLSTRLGERGAKWAVYGPIYALGAALTVCQLREMYLSGKFASGVQDLHRGLQDGMWIETSDLESVRKNVYYLIDHVDR